jgi:hypothetical protein
MVVIKASVVYNVHQSRFMTWSTISVSCIGHTLHSSLVLLSPHGHTLVETSVNLQLNLENDTFNLGR